MDNKLFYESQVKICKNAGDDTKSIKAAGKQVHAAVMARWPKVNTASGRFKDLKDLVQDERFEKWLKLSPAEQDQKKAAERASVEKKHENVKVINLADYKALIDTLDVDDPIQATIVAGASLGRRSTELAFGTYMEEDSPFHFKFGGQLKTRDDVEYEYEIPILFDSLNTKLALITIKDSILPGEQREDYGRRMEKRVNAAIKRLFNDESASMKMLRHVYCNVAFRCDQRPHTLSANLYSRNVMGHSNTDITHIYQDIRVIFPGEEFMVNLNKDVPDESESESEPEAEMAPPVNKAEDIKLEISVLENRLSKLQACLRGLEGMGEEEEKWNDDMDRIEAMQEKEESWRFLRENRKRKAEDQDRDAYEAELGQLWEPLYHAKASNIEL